jgi:Ca2+-transporting ATPase
VKGAPEVILERCTHVLDGGTERALTRQDRRTILRAQERMAGAGLRTLAAARRVLPPDHPVAASTVEEQLTFLGLFGLVDPPRPEVPDAMALAQSAGLRVIMITGDAPATAEAVAEQIGLRPGRVLRGPELESMDDEALREALADDVLFARTTPAHKLRIVRLLQEQGEIVGMTGDGVNDAPALKRADIGIAMGVRGTDVARGAADIVLTDDNFATIVGAVQEGRRQYDNIQKFLRYLLSSNVGEVVAILAALIAGGPLILLPVQILWMNLVTDGLAAVALGLEAPERDVMRRPPRPPGIAFLDRSGLFTVLGLGSAIGVVALALFAWALGRDADAVATAQSVAFTGIIVAELVNVLNFRSLRAPLASVGLFSNPWLLAAVAGSLLLQAGAVYLPGAQALLHTVPLAGSDWLLMFAAAAPIFLLPEAWKWWRQRAAAREARFTG